MRRSQKILETAPKDGVFKGDLKFGRCLGHNPSRSDHAGLENAPVAPLVLVQPRDGFVWSKDSRVKEVRKNVTHSQYLTNLVVDKYVELRHRGHTEMRLTVGRQRL